MIYSIEQCGGFPMKKLLNHPFFLMHREQILKYGVLVLVFAVALVVFFFPEKGKDEAALVLEKSGEESVAEAVESPEESDDVLFVDIAGAIATPGVLELPEGSRVEDAIKAAGGLTDKADVTTINRAAPLTDGEKIYIPEEGEDPEVIKNASSAATASAAPEADGGKVNINTADAEELQRLKGVGPVTAEKIVQYRITYGAFSTIEDIRNVDGIGDKTFENLREDIVV